jgi:hypothetical protein
VSPGGDYAVFGNGSALVRKPEHLAALLGDLTPWQKALVHGALHGADTPALACAADLAEEQVPQHLALLVRHLRITGWDDPVFQSRPVRRAVGRLTKRKKQRP